MHKKVYFRADASADIGYGHFIRSLALADMLKNDFNCTFFTQTPNEYQIQEARGVCPLIELPSDQGRFNQFLELLNGDEIVVLDNYFFTTDYQKQIREKGCKLVCIDDMHDKHYVADIIINHGCDSSDLFSTEPYTQLCLGLEWALLRKPFLEVSRDNIENPDKIESVVVCFGGSDLSNLTDKTIQILLENSSSIRIDAIVGSHYNSTLSAENRRYVNYHRNISAKQVANLFSNTDLAIVSASTACIEALASGAKVAAGWYVENQKELYSYLVRNKYIYALNDFSSINLRLIGQSKIDVDLDFSKISNNYIACLSSFYNSGFDVDNYSYVNYVDLPTEYHKIIWEVRNSEGIRSLMVDTNKFSFESHLSFVDKLRGDKSKIYWAVLQDSEFVGSISLHPIDWDANVGEWGIFLNPQYFGNGIGTEIGIKFLRHIISSTVLNRIEAKVKINNTHSLSYHKKIGFELVSNDEHYYYMEWK